MHVIHLVVSTITSTFSYYIFSCLWCTVHNVNTCLHAIMIFMLSEENKCSTFSIHLSHLIYDLVSDFIAAFWKSKCWSNASTIAHFDTNRRRLKEAALCNCKVLSVTISCTYPSPLPPLRQLETAKGTRFRSFLHKQKASSMWTLIFRFTESFCDGEYGKCTC